MKITTVRIKEDLRWRLNKLKNEWKLDTLDSTIRKLIDFYNKFLNKNSSTTSFTLLSSGKGSQEQTTTSTSGASNTQEEEK